MLQQNKTTFASSHDFIHLLTFYCMNMPVDVGASIGLFKKLLYNFLYGLVAQRLRHWIRDRKVYGSMPSRCTTK